MPHPDPRELATANVGSNIRPRSATRDIRSSQTGGGWQLGKHTQHGSDAQFTQMGITGDFIRVFPARAEFRNTEPHVTHVLTVTVVNRSDHSKRIRFVPPKTKEFTLHQIPSIAVAPGLEMTADLEYYSESDKDFFDEVTVLCESDRITIPVFAYAPRAELHFDGYCLFGSVAPSQMTIRYVDIVNRGARAADFRLLTKQELPFVVEPMSGRLGPDGSDDCFLRLKVSFAGEDLGVQRSVLEVEVNGSVIGNVLDISALVVRQQFEIVAPDGTGRLDRINFGTVYVGEERQEQVTLVNDGPDETEFKFVIPRPEMSEAGDPPMYSAFPPEGKIAPYEQLTVVVKYHPPRFEVAKGFKSKVDILSQREEHEVMVLVTNPDESQSTNLKLSGRAVFPAVTFSDHELYFANTQTGKNTELQLVIKNHHDELPVTFRSTRVAHFRCRPASGRLLPLQSTQVIVSFMPNQLGRHKSAFTFEILGASGQPVGRASVMVSGTCDRDGPKKKLAGGTAATDETFKPDFNFQAPDALAKQTSKSNFVRLKHWIKHEPEVNENTAKYTVDATRMAAVDANRQKYGDFLKQQYELRNEIHTLAEGREFALGVDGGAPSGDPRDDPDYAKPATELGLFGMPIGAYPPGVGLREPRLVLPPANEPLYLKHRPGEAPVVIKPKNRVIDEDRLLTQKFKPYPTTARERKECQAFLNARQILQLGVNPSSMEFGSACVHADVKKCFAVSNDTDQPVLVSVDTHGNPILARTTPASQVIPAGSTAGFDIVLYMEVEQQYETHFTYTVNGHHSFAVPIRAQAVPVMLSLSKQRINFTFPGHSYQPTVSEIITVINPGNNPADFRIENQSPQFTASPAFGTVDASGSEEVVLTYNPGQTQKHEHTMKVTVVGGSAMTLQLTGEVDEGVLQAKSRNLDFGPIAAGLSARKTVTLANTGGAPTVFYIDLADLRAKCPGLSLTPDKGLLMAGETLQLVATVRSERALKIDGPLMVNVRGGKPVKINVKADVQIPVVELRTDELDFGSAYLGAMASRSLVAANLSAIPAILTLDLRKYPEFTVQVPDELDFDDEEEPAQGKSPALNELSQGSEMAEPEGPRVRFRVPPSAEGRLEITYQPVALAQHAFELPLALQGMPAGSVKALRRAVVAEAIKPRMLMSSAAVDFSKRCPPPPPRVVVSANMKSFSYTQEVTLTNCDDKQMSVDCRMKGQAVDQGILRLEQVVSSQQLQVSKSITLRIHFVPRSDADYRAKLAICLDGVTDKPYFTIEVKGSGVFPSLGFDRREVVLPVVPTGQVTSATFFVINYGYDNLDLKYQLPPESSAVPLQISFPQGMMIGVVKTHLPVEVSFVSKKSVSFSAKIDFLDGNGNVYSIPVVGTTDSCTLSVFPFLTIHRASYHLDHKQGKPAMQQQVSEIKEPYLSPEGEILLDGGSDPAEAKRRNAQANASFLCECAVLTRKESVQAFLEWANLNMFRQPVVRFPDDLLEAKGRPLIDVVEASTGKTVPGQSRKAGGNKREEAQQLLSNYTEMLTFLKSYGALVNTVVPEYLLPYESFQRLFMDGKGGMLEEQKPWYESYYSLVSGATWMALLYQTVRLFVLNRLTPKLLKALPGVNQKNLPAHYVHQGSNCYSSAEVVLLQWLTYHHLQVVPNDKLVVSNFDADLHDCRVYASVLVSHVPSTKKGLVSLRKTDGSARALLENATILHAALQSLGLDFCPSAQDLCTAPARDTLLFCIYLFNTMPGFIPKATVQFEGRLNDAVQKHIELSNPSNKPLVYTVRIDGTPEFRCAETLRLGPRDKALFPITVAHTARAPAEAQIFFIGERTTGGSAGITMVFNLRSEVKTYRRSDTIVRQGRLYEAVSVDIPVKNPANDVEKEMTLSILDLTAQSGSAAAPAGPQKGGGRQQKKKKASGPNGDATTSHLLPATTFWLKRDRIKLKKGATGNVHLMLLPMRLQGHSCLVFIRDEEANAETCFEVQVSVDLPAATETVKFSHQMRNTVVKDVTVGTKNASIDKCRSHIMELMGQAAGKEWYKQISEQPKIDYRVQYLTEHCVGPKEISVHGQPEKGAKGAGRGAGGAGGEGAGGQGQPPANKLPLEIRPKGPGKYESRVILRSAFDVRVLDVECTITSLGTRAELIFTCSARQSITQEIPIINHSEQPWSIHADLQGQHFTGSKDLVVPQCTEAGPGKASYNLTFSPHWMCQVEGDLILRNATIGDTYQYKLQGVGEEPIAEDHVVIDCKARWRTKHMLNVRNVLKGKDIVYRVECDMQGVSGAEELRVDADGEGEYELSVMMPRGGNFTGSISFIAPSQEYIWFTFEVNAENPPAEKTVQLRAKARTAVAADITIVNPLDTVVTFDVIMQGEGLLGAPSVALQPQESAVYELIYSPLMAGRSIGGLIFVNDDIGEFWYELELESEEPDPIVVGNIKAELGKTSRTRLTIENPLGFDIEGELLVDNATNFSVSVPDNPYEDAVLLVPAYETAEFDLHYAPSSMGEPEKCECCFSHPQAGTWVFECVGRGHPPSEMEVTKVSATVMSSSHNLVRFRNPLNTEITVRLSLELEEVAEEDGAFQLMVPPDEEVVLSGFQEIEVPVLFTPKRMLEHSARLVIVDIGSDIKWVFPITGTAEASLCVYLGKFTCKARELLKHTFLLELSGVEGSEGMRGDDRTELEVIPPPEAREVLSTSLVVQVDDGPPKPPSGTCRVKMVFEPLKTLRTKVELKVSKASGGRWAFDFDLVALAADIDDTIRIEGAINKTSSVAFRMKNQFDVEAEFRAYFLPDSPDELSVSPAVGVLAPYSSEDLTEFKVSFHPKTYGKAFVGRLVVETEEMQWIYEVIGEHPRYQGPQDVATKVDTRLAPGKDPAEYRGSKPAKDYHRENTKAIKLAQATRK